MRLSWLCTRDCVFYVTKVSETLAEKLGVPITVHCIDRRMSQGNQIHLCQQHIDEELIPLVWACPFTLGRICGMLSWVCVPVKQRNVEIKRKRRKRGSKSSLLVCLDPYLCNLHGNGFTDRHLERTWLTAGVCQVWIWQQRVKLADGSVGEGNVRLLMASILTLLINSGMSITAFTMTAALS